jgi:hypothetical protein
MTNLNEPKDLLLLYYSQHTQASKPHEALPTCTSHKPTP